ncbi:MAG: glycosyltransferase family 1 protein [Paraburkholderia sp.]|uniref:glycosyltransferase family 4 protein n=1 Tax=Paraburkholderia sp. TaxID=1926495 RepID=UPI001212D886|nr:glycosyltransferase family 1 protein [Paraburkholderia sp.]TAM06456.1 MAG: glycosyltransferase family 1 protein [Paraburkholderia sp.]
MVNSRIGQTGVAGCTAWIAAVIERRSVRVARERLLLARARQGAPVAGPRQLLVDVSVIQRHDAGTGIQRVVRALLDQLLTEAPAGYIVRPVAATRKRSYCYVNEGGDHSIEPPTISMQRGDVFLGLDLAAHLIPMHRRQLAEWKANGAALHFMVYDLLPLQHPEWFSSKLIAAFRRWIKSVAILADQAICISRTVESDLRAALAHRYGFDLHALPTCVIPMGWDISSTRPSRGLPLDFQKLLSHAGKHGTALIVGTIEPRKGHAQILSAFERLWSDGQEYNLIVVGRPGWKTESLQAKLREHRLKGERLFWLEDASDDALLALYEACDGVIVASHAEGFGLPLLEALGRGKPVLARDLPVFRQHGFSGVEYFSTHDEEALPEAIANWLDRVSDSSAAPVASDDLPAWRDTATALVKSLRHGNENFNRHVCAMDAQSSEGIW